ncbi:hypothetical protein HY229_05615 [Candidatus Acetothermia bacterium]|nr:hypothetical protein [Candidatus Acetothermia bacterium]MBI3643561.1 hypothetical protein [Candidatus Acetothermia bacterium]
MKRELHLKGLIGFKDQLKVEVRTQGSESSFKSYCCVLTDKSSFTPLELQTYSDELDAREGHLQWLSRRDRCLAYVQSLGIIPRKNHH